MLGALEMMSEQLHRLTFAMPVADDSENHKIHSTLVFAQVHVCCLFFFVVVRFALCYAAHVTTNKSSSTWEVGHSLVNESFIQSSSKRPNDMRSRLPYDCESEWRYADKCVAKRGTEGEMNTEKVVPAIYLQNNFDVIVSVLARKMGNKSASSLTQTSDRCKECMLSILLMAGLHIECNFSGVARFISQYRPAW